MMNGKLNPGTMWKPAPHSIWNRVIQRAIDPLEAPLEPQFDQIPTDAIVLKNTTGGNLSMGRVLEIGANRLTAWDDPENLWFTGQTPNPNGTKEIAITTSPMGRDDLWWCQLSGACLAKVNVNHIQHVYADVDVGTTLLQSKWHGRAKILDRQPGSGEKWALIRICEMFRGPIKGIVTQTGGIPPRGSGNVKVRWAGADSSPISTVTVHRKWMVGNHTAATGTELLFWWYPDEQIYDTGEEGCP